MGQLVGLKAGKTYTLRITARMNVAGDNQTQAGIQYRVNGQTDNTQLLLNFNSTSYETKEKVFTVPEEGVYGASVFAFKTKADSLKKFYWTNIQLSERGTPTNPPSEIPSREAVTTISTSSDDAEEKPDGGNEFEQ